MTIGRYHLTFYSPLVPYPCSGRRRVTMDNGYCMRVELPPDVAAEVRELVKVLKRPAWRIIEEALQRWIVEDTPEAEKLWPS